MGTYVITGANRGIGLEIVRALRARGDDVIGVCRSSSPELASTKAKVIEGIDVAAADGPSELAKRLAGTSIGVLVNNAGIYTYDKIGALDAAAIEKQFRVNALAPLLITQALLPLFAKPAKVAVITSRMGSIGDNTTGGYYGYRMSKAATNIAFVSLARDLSARGISVGIFHPGLVATTMTGGQGIPPPESAKGLVARLDELGPANSGLFLDQNGKTVQW